MQDALEGDIKSSGPPTSGIQPVDGPLPVCILVVLGQCALIAECIPKLSNDKVGGRGFHVVPYMAAIVALDKIKTACPESR